MNSALSISPNGNKAVYQMPASSQINIGLEGKNDYLKKKPERVKVFVRLRPFLEEEYGSSKVCSIDSFDSKNKVIQIKKDYDKKVFNFDGIFEPKISQEEVYSAIAAPVIQSVMEGFNGTIFAYGQTGTGKTFTMVGGNQKHDIGIIPRSLEEIFSFVENDSSHAYSIQLSCVQIYMEMLQDLINPENKVIRIRESPENGVFISGTEWVIIQNPSEALQLVELAEKNRAVAFTALNACSSRSHVILMVQVQKRNRKVLDQQSSTSSLNNSLVQYNTHSFAQVADNNQSSSVSLVTSVLYLVDLAGSERVKKSKSTGERLHEAKAINSSLSTLGKCIQALSEGKGNFVPFRESKLTRLLQDSLGGNSKTSLVVTIGPAMKHIEETLSSLGFGQRAMKVENKPVVNVQKDYYLLSMQLQQELDGKDDQIHELEIRGLTMYQKLKELQQQLELIQFEKQELEGTQKHLKMSLCNGIESNQAVEVLEKQKKVEVEQVEKKYKNMLKKAEEDYKKFLEEIDQTLNEQEEEIDQLKAENWMISSQMESLKDSLKVKEDEINAEKESVEKEKQELVAQLKTLKDRFNEKELTYNKMIHDKVEECKQIREQQASERNQSAAQMREIEKLKQIIEQDRSDKDSLHEQILRLENTQRESQIEASKIAQLNSLEKDELLLKIQNLSKIIEELRVNNQEFKQTNESLAQREQKLLRNIEELEKTKKDLEQSVSKNKIDIETLSNNNYQFNIRNEEQMQKLENLRIQIEKLVYENGTILKEKDESYQQKEKENRQLRDQVEESKRVIREQNEEKGLMMQQLEVKIDELIQHNKREVAAMKKQVSEKEAFLTQQQNELQQLRNQYGELQEDYEEDQENLAELEKKLSDQAAIFAAERLIFTEKIQESREQQQNENCKRTELESALSDLKNQFEETKQNLKETEEIASKAQQEKEEKNLEIQNVTKLLEDQEQLGSQLSKEILILSTKVQVYQERIIELEGEKQQEQIHHKEEILKLEQGVAQRQKEFEEQKEQLLIKLNEEKQNQRKDQEIYDQQLKDLEISCNKAIEAEIKINQEKINLSEIQHQEVVQNLETTVKQLKLEYEQSTESLQQQAEKSEQDHLKVVKQLEEQLTSLQMDLSENQADLQIVNQEKDNLEQANQDLQESLTELQNKIEGELQQVMEQIKLKDEIIQQNQQEINNKDQQITQMSEEIQEQRENLQQKEQELESMKVNLLEIGKKLEDITQDNLNKDSQLRINEEDILNLNNQVQQLKDLIVQKESEIEKKEKELDLAAQETNQLLSDIEAMKSAAEAESLEKQEQINSLASKIQEMAENNKILENINKDQELNIQSQAQAYQEREQNILELQVSLENQQKTMNGHIEELNNTIMALETTIKENQEALISQQAEISQKESQLDEFITLIGDMKQKIEDKQIVEQEMKLRAELNDERNLILEQQLIGKEQRIQAEKIKMELQIKQIEEVLSSEISDKESIINEFKEKFAKQEIISKELDEQIQQILGECNYKIEAKTQQMDALNTQLNEIQQMTQDHFQKAQEEKQTLLSQISELTESRNEKDILINQLNQSLALTNKDIASYKRQSTDHIAAQNEEINQIRSLIEAQSQQLSAFIIQKVVRVKQRKQIAKLFLTSLLQKTKSIHSLQHSIKTIKLSTEALEEQLAYQQTHKEHQTKAIQDITFINNQLHEKLAQSENELETKKQEINSLMREKHDSSLQIVTYVNKIEALQEGLDKAEFNQTKFNNYQQQQLVHANIESKVRKIQSTLSRHLIKKQLGVAFAENQQLKLNLKGLADDYSKLQYSFDKLKVEYSKIQESSSDKTEESEGYFVSEKEGISSVSEQFENKNTKISSLEQLTQENQIIIDQLHQQIQELRLSLKQNEASQIISRFITMKKWQKNSQQLIISLKYRIKELQRLLKEQQEKAAGFQIAKLLKQKLYESKIKFCSELAYENQKTTQELQLKLNQTEKAFCESLLQSKREISARKIQASFRSFKLISSSRKHQIQIENIKKISNEYQGQIDLLKQQLNDLEEGDNRYKSTLGTSVSHKDQRNNVTPLQENINTINIDCKKNLKEDKENNCHSLLQNNEILILADNSMGNSTKKTLILRLRELDAKWREQYYLLEKRLAAAEREKQGLGAVFDQTLELVAKDKEQFEAYQVKHEKSENIITSIQNI